MMLRFAAICFGLSLVVLLPGSVRTDESKPAEEVPAVTGLPAAKAKAALQGAGFVAKFNLGKSAPSSDKELTVYEQDPPAGEISARGQTVLLKLFAKRSASVVVPGVIGRGPKEAKAALLAAGLVVKFRLGPAAQAGGAQHVSAEDPAPGSAVDVGTVVSLTIDGGAGASAITTTDEAKTATPGAGGDQKAAPSVPTLVGKTAGQAKAAVLSAGLTPKFLVGTTATDSTQAMTVERQAPPAGTWLAPAGEVRITLYALPATPAETGGGATIKRRPNPRVEADLELQALKAQDLALLVHPPRDKTPEQLKVLLADVRWKIANRYAKDGDFRQAAEYGWASLRLDRLHPERWERLGDLCQFSGELMSEVDSLRAYERALALEPGRRHARVKAAGACLMIGKPVRALDHLEYELISDDGDATQQVMQVYTAACILSNRIPRGIAFCREKLQHEKSQTYRVVWAILENTRGNSAEAVKLLAEVQKQEGKSSPLSSAAAKLQQSYTSKGTSTSGSGK
jgi:beta-lactam-binding protein with PASTA domain